MIVNVIMLKLKDPTTDNIAAARDKLLSLNGNVPQLRDLTVAANIRTGATGYDLVMIAKYDSLADFDAYAAHPFHVEVGKYIQSAAAEIASVTYEE